MELDPVSVPRCRVRVCVWGCVCVAGCALVISVTLQLFDRMISSGSVVTD